MPRHDARQFQILRTPRQWDTCASISSLQMYCVHKWQNKGNIDKNRVLKAISRDKQ